MRETNTTHRTRRVAVSTFRAMVLVCGLLSLASCATGIDSTGRITANDVKREAAPVTPEQTFLADVTPQPLQQWQQGKQLYVTDDRIKLMLGNTAPEGSLAGTLITFRGYKARQTATADTVTDFLFSSDGGEIVYTARFSPRWLMEKHPPRIPFTIERSMIDTVRNRLTGNTYYVLVADRYTLDGSNSKRSKFIPVTVKDVRPGNSVYPLAVVLDEGGAQSMVYLDPGPEPVTGRGFAAQLAFDNPRRRYPAISDEAWANIVANTVGAGMTRDECRLALGSPINIDRRNTGAYLLELWSYDNGRYLMFEDGLLRDFRK